MTALAHLTPLPSTSPTPPEGDSAIQRLRAARLRPTTARIAVLQAIEAAPDSISADEVFRQLSARGARASISTVYRVIHEMELSNVVQREWDEAGTAQYRLRHTRKSARLRLQCADCGHGFNLVDAGLHARLLAAARRAGMEPEDPVLTVRLDLGGCHNHGIR